MPLCLLSTRKSLQSYQRAVAFSAQLLADCFLSSALVWIQWETRGLSKYFTAGLASCVCTCPISFLVTLLFFRCSHPNRPLQPLVLVLLPLLALISASFYCISALDEDQTDLWISNFTTIIGLEVAILEPIRTLVRVAVGGTAKEKKCCEVYRLPEREIYPTKL